MPFRKAGRRLALLMLVSGALLAAPQRGAGNAVGGTPGAGSGARAGVETGVERLERLRARVRLRLRRRGGGPAVLQAEGPAGEAGGAAGAAGVLARSPEVQASRGVAGTQS